MSELSKKFIEVEEKKLGKIWIAVDAISFFRPLSKTPGEIEISLTGSENVLVAKIEFNAFKKKLEATD